MKACIYIGPPHLAWCRKYFPDKAPGELPIAGKEWCAFLFDLCTMLRCIDKLFIVDCYPAERLSTLAERDGYWSTNLTYLPSEVCASPWQLLHKQSLLAYNPKEELLLFWGLPLPNLNAPEDLLHDLRPADPTAIPLSAGVFLWKEGQFFECACPLHGLETIQQYFDLNFKLLQDPGIYTLPGYSAQASQGIGQNVTILPNGTFEPPLIIQNNCFLGRTLTLANGVILGKNTFVDDYTTIKHSIVLDNTYLGRRMFLEDKIVCENRVIDVHTGAYVDLQDEFLAMDSRQKFFDPIRAVGRPTAAVLLLLLLPWFLLGRLFRRSLDKVPFFHLLLRVYPKLWGVLVWKTNLVRVGANDPDYAFRFSDRYMLPFDEKTREKEDIFYQQHRTVGLMLGVVCRSLLKRLFQLSEPPIEETSDLPTTEMDDTAILTETDASEQPSPDSTTKP